MSCYRSEIPDFSLSAHHWSHTWWILIIDINDMLMSSSILWLLQPKVMYEQNVWPESVHISYIITHWSGVSQDLDLYIKVYCTASASSRCLCDDVGHPYVPTVYLSRLIIFSEDMFPTTCALLLYWLFRTLLLRQSNAASFWIFLSIQKNTASFWTLLSIQKSTA